MRLTIAIACSAILCGAVGASAAGSGSHFVDFTDESLWTNLGGEPVTNTIAGPGGSIDVTITGLSAIGANELNFADEVDLPNAPMCAGGGGDFACTSDGAGIGGFNSDEVDAGDDGLSIERLIVDFSGLVEITDLFFLDMFVGMEQVEGATAVYQPSGVPQDYETVTNAANGFAAFALADESSGRQTSLQVTFTAFGGNDMAGVGDFALAGISFNLLELPIDAETPLPATLPLLVAGLASLGLLRIRRPR